MKLETYIEREIENMKKFKEYWESEHKENPEDFPDDEHTSTGEWDEQYYSWKLGL